jgi:glycosyltransferase involved in cell wall biosynthesis
MGEADAFIYHVRDLPVLRYGISSNKLCDYLASGRPVIFAANSSNNPVAEAQAGISIPPENPQALAAAIVRLQALPFEERVRMGENGVEYARRNLDVRVLAQRLESALSNGQIPDPDNHMTPDRVPPNSETILRAP